MRADLFSVTAPLSIRSPDGVSSVMAECFRTANGLLYFDLYWHLGRPENTMHELRGELAGDGPWKINGHIIKVLGCQGSEPELASRYAAWTAYLQRADADYPPRPLIEAIARKRGAQIRQG